MKEYNSPQSEKESSYGALEAIIRRDRLKLEALSRAGRPLTTERLQEIDSGLLDVVGQADVMGVEWPDSASEVAVSNVSRLLSYQGDDADEAFAINVISERSQAFNNFPQLISAKPEIPMPHETSVDYMRRTPHFAYASKPYLYRAHMLQPEFMDALQKSVENIGMTRWNEKILEGVADPEFNHEEVALLTASRIAYTLLANLMRQDDLQRQYRWMGMPDTGVPLIEDPAGELWS